MLHPELYLRYNASEPLGIFSIIITLEKTGRQLHGRYSIPRPYGRRYCGGVNKTVIAIAHRLSTLRNMDRIIVLGTHEELLKQKGKYAEFWNHQSGGFMDEDQD